VGGQVDHVLSGDQHRARGRLLEPGDHAQRGGLAAAAGAEQGEELALCDVEIEVVNGDQVAERLGDALQPHGRLAQVCSLLVRQLQLS
jgi:hypothetical protein